MEMHIDQSSIHYTIEGEGHPLILLSGFSLDHHVMMGAFEPALQGRKGWQRIYLDLPGTGRTPGHPSLVTNDAILDFLLAFIDRVIPNQSFAAAGFSYGGYIARAVLHHRLHNMTGLMLMNPLINPVSENRDLPPPHQIMSEPGAVELIPEAMREIVLANTAALTRQVVGRIAQEFAPSFALADQGFLAQLRTTENYCFSFDVDDLPQPFDKPVLIVTGRQDSNVGFAEAYQQSRRYSRVTYAVVDRAGHSLHLEQQPLFNLLVNEWLDRIEESLSIAVTT